MKEFASLLAELETTKSQPIKAEALTFYLQNASNKDRLWAISLLNGSRPKRLLSPTTLLEWAKEKAELSMELFLISKEKCTDINELTANLYPKSTLIKEEPLQRYMKLIDDSFGKEEFELKKAILESWDHMDTVSRLYFNKLMSGSFRIQVSKRTLLESISTVAKNELYAVSYGLESAWSPRDADFRSLFIEPNEKDILYKPIPFLRTSESNAELSDLGEAQDFIIEPALPSIRAQLIIKQGEFFLWNENMELITSKFPELRKLNISNSDEAVIDLEIAAIGDDGFGSQESVLKRLKKKRVSWNSLTDESMIFVCTDILWSNEGLLIHKPLEERKRVLESFISKTNSPYLSIIEEKPLNDWVQVKEYIEKGKGIASLGAVLKKKNSKYELDNLGGPWYKVMPLPMEADLVLIYASTEARTIGNTTTELTLASKHNNNLVPTAKIKLDLSKRKFEMLKRFIKENTLERFGPVRSVKAEQVFRVAFDEVALSARRKSGIRLVNVRLIEWKKDDKDSPIEELNALRALI